ncbi:NAD(P)-dependent oxidoreductase [Pantoea vagans]|uniref:NAD(P)-dependent oxidoreductase n=1 Tax=Pantoea vagans TaxID=470934 RepID=UPI0023B02D30|nr:NAD(P)-dependent oxidoreductase [Pantoea vagans]MDE8557638.1 NAD(P)-dependent oxidoreductase [Pantoea vagans]MDE8577206.1 NAD(P)-dependent oxidoreductase [Pantoea vagans]
MTIQLPVILVTASVLAPQAVSLLNALSLVYAGKQPDEDILFRLCQQHKPVAINVRYGKINARIKDATPALRVISKHGSGINIIDQQAAAASDIRAKSAPGANAAAVTEHSWAMILDIAKSVITLDQRMRQGSWDKSPHKSVELKGRALGLLEPGAIGGRVARSGRAFSMKVLACNSFTKTFPDECESASLDDLLQQADIISLHCPLIEQTRQMINAEKLALFKKGAILVNTARGGFIKDDALLAALNNGTIAWAALDSFPTEPLTAPPIWQHVDKVILSPNIGNVSDNSCVKIGTVAARHILNVLASVKNESAVS